MAIEDVSLYEDIKRLSEGVEYGTRKIFECTLIVDDFRLKVISVNSYVFNRDYKTSYGDSIVVEVMVPMGTYASFIYPKRKKLKAQIKVVTVDSNGNEIESDNGTVLQLFRATIIDSKNPNIMDVNEESEDVNLGDTSTLLNVSLQLTDVILETIRQTNFQTIIKDSDLESVVKCLLRGDSYLDDDLPKADGVIMTPSDNTKIYNYILLSPTLNAVDLTDWLQDYYGIYNNGLGIYLQKKFWYVFPLLQTEKFKADETSVTIISLTPSKLSGSEKTFDFKEGHLVILATGETDHVDNSDAIERNVGNGFRYINADMIIDKYSSTVNGITNVSRENNIIEYKSSEREDGNNYIPFYKNIATSNHAKMLSRLATNKTNEILLTWENSSPDLLIPGMRVRYLYRENNEIRKLSGVLINVLHRYASIDPGITQTVHASMSTLTILAQSGIDM